MHIIKEIIQNKIKIFHWLIKNNNQINNSETNKGNLLEILIYYFYYEKDFNEKKLKIFNKNKSYYYLINPKWFDDFLAHYKYQKFNNYLNNTSNRKPRINFDNLNLYQKL